MALGDRHESGSLGHGADSPIGSEESAGWLGGGTILGSS